VDTVPIRIENSDNSATGNMNDANGSASMKRDKQPVSKKYGAPFSEISGYRVK